MKRYILTIVLGMVCACAWSDNSFRAFTDTKGRTIRGRVVTYDSKSQVVTIERDNHMRASIPLSILSKNDQKYVKAWDLNKDFLNETRFKISADRKRSDNADKRQSDFNSKRDVKNIGYLVSLENHSTTTFTNIKIDYCIFYDQEELKGQQVQSKDGVYYGTLNVDKMPPASTKELMTHTVMVYKEELNSDWYYGSGAKNTQRGEVIGIWLRASIKTPDGDEVVRDYCIPDSLPKHKNWTTSTVNVGMN